MILYSVVYSEKVRFCDDNHAVPLIELVSGFIINWCLLWLIYTIVDSYSYKGIYNYLLFRNYMLVSLIWSWNPRRWLWGSSSIHSIVHPMQSTVKHLSIHLVITEDIGWLQSVPVRSLPWVSPTNVQGARRVMRPVACGCPAWLVRGGTAYSLKQSLVPCNINSTSCLYIFFFWLYIYEWKLKMCV